MPDQLTCICSKCNKQFLLVGDTDRVKEPASQVSIDSCESDGIYGMSVSCPHCGYEHDLYH